MLTTLATVQLRVKGLRDLSLTADGIWQITGGSPRFTLTPAAGVDIAAGWHLVSIDIDASHDQTLGLPTDVPIAIRFLPESGSVPLARRPVPVISGRRTRVVHVPEGTARIELDISPWCETAKIGAVSLRHLPTAVAASMMSADVGASSVRGSTDGKSLVGRLRDARSGHGNRAVLSEIAVAYEHLQHRRSGDGVDYPSWRIRNATVFDDDADRLRARVAELPGGGPTISVVVPVYNTDVRWLRAAIDSVRNQIYDNWQLILVDDNSTNPAVPKVLAEYAALDDRILARYRDTNGHIATATNDGLAVATGEFVAFMDHDDELAPFALAAVALEAGSADVLYTDEDKIDETGKHFGPHCKPRWNPELFLGQNYLSHLTVIRRSIITTVGGLRPSSDGAQDYDLLLRVIAHVQSPERIRHVPVVAYHWRAIEGSTALSPDEKTYAEDAAVRSLKNVLGDAWKISLTTAPTAYRSTPPLATYPLVSIIIPTRDRVELLEQCVNSLLRTTYPAVEIVVVDNDSQEQSTRDWLAAFENGHDHRVVAAPGPFNYSRINNLAAEQARGELLLLLNNDTEVINPDWLTEMVRWISQPGIGAVGAKLLYPNDTIQHAGIVLGLGGLAGHGHLHEPADSSGYFSRLALTHEVGAVTGACLLTHARLWNALGGLDEELAVAFNDVDYCMRLRHDLGERVLWVADALLYHHESVSRGAEDDPAKVERFNREVDLALSRWADHLAADPAYSPNLSLDGDSFTLAREPRLDTPWAE